MPQAMMLGCSAMNSPAQGEVDGVMHACGVWARGRGGRINCGATRCRAGRRQEHKGRGHPPRLNMAIPSPASERMEMDFSTIVGMETCHLRSMNITRACVRSDKTRSFATVVVVVTAMISTVMMISLTKQLCSSTCASVRRANFQLYYCSVSVALLVPDDLQFMNGAGRTGPRGNGGLLGPPRQHHRPGT